MAVNTISIIVDYEGNNKEVMMTVLVCICTYHFLNFINKYGLINNNNI